MATQAKEVLLTPPLSIAGCRLWLDGTDPAGTGIPPSNAATVSTWVDKSGNGNNASATVSGATFTAASQNGMGYITFPTGKYFTTTNFVPSANNTPSIFLVCQQTSYSGSGNSEIIYCTVGSPYPFYTLDILGVLGTKTLALNMYNNAGQIGTISIATPTLVSIVGSGSPNYTATLWGNGTSNATLTGSSTNPMSVSMGFIIGAQSGFIGNIYEIILYNTALTTTQQQQVEGYLSWKWGLQTSFPGSHPYAYSYQYQSITRTVPFKATSSSYFLPTAISGCQLWMDAADSTTITRSGANISQWNDKANLYTGTATNNPQYNSNPINGLPTIRFDGGSSRYVLLTANNFNYSTMTYCLVIRWISGSGGFMGTDTPGNYGRALAISSPNVQLLLYSQFYTTTVPLPAGQPCILFAYFNGTTDFTVILNGTKTLFSVAQGSGNTNTNGFNIGVFNPGNGGSHSFDMGEGIVYNSILSDAQRQQVEGYLSWKWGLQSSLVTTHPNSTTAYVPFPFPTAIPKASIKYWSPTRISGTQLWLDGADPAGTGVAPSNGATVSSWADKSGNSANGTAVGTSTYDNSSKGISFAGSSSYSLPNGTIAPGASNYTIFIICYPTDISYYPYVWAAGVGGADTSMALIFYPSGQIENGFYTDFMGIAPSGSVSINNSYMFSSAYNGTRILYKNGTSIVSGTPSGTKNISTANNYLGQNQSSNGAGTYYKGIINEFIVYNTSLSQTQRQQVEGYLAWKWGLVTSLPAGHPYINFPPSP